MGGRMVTAIASSRGFSSIELLVSSVISMIVLSIVSSLFLSSQSQATKRIKQLVLQQSVTGLLMQIKRDIQRAGYDRSNDVRVVLNGSQLPVESTANSLAYAYRIDTGGDEAFQNVGYFYDADSVSTIKICEKTSPEPLTFQQTITSGFSGYCYSVFDSNVIQVDGFQFSSESIQITEFSSQLHSIQINASLIEQSSITISAFSTLLQRN